MAKLALTWQESIPPPEEKREAKVVRLLREGDAGSWGATEARSSFVYPVSLQPLRRIAGVFAEGGRGVDLVQAAEVKEPAGLDVSQLLLQVFPAKEDDLGDNSGTNGGSNGLTTTTTTGTGTGTGTRNGASDRTQSSSVPGDSTSSLIDRASGSRSSACAHDKDRRRKERKRDKQRTAMKPVFHAYGSANTTPPTGGVVYGGYMLSHSICPQVFPNKPKTRQVHSSTQRMAVRAAAKARATSANTSRAAVTSGSANTTRVVGAVRMRGANSGPGIAGRDGGHGYVREFQRKWAHGRNRQGKAKSAPAGTGAGGKKVVEAAGAEDSSGRGSTATFDPVAMFSALPEDIEPWGTARTGRASPATTPQRRRRPMTTLRAAKQSPETGDAFPSEGDKPVSPTAIMHDATCASTEKHGGQSQRAAAAADEDQAVDESCVDGGSARQQQQQQQHEWTIDKHLANDPRNYKFLPRGWAGELITPAGIAGPRPSSTEALIPGWTAGRPRKDMRPDVTSTDGCRRGAGDECGVGDCLRWDFGS